MQASEIKLRCSSLGYLMTNDRTKEKGMGETAKVHLVDCFVSYKYGRREQVEGKFLDKGNEREQDAITLLSRIDKRFFKKNDQRLSNDFITGECDIFIGEDVKSAEETIDTKTSWSAHTFFRAKNKPLDSNYYYQGLGYMWLTGAKKHTVAYCLVNGTAQAILDEKRRLAYRYIDAQRDQQYIAKARQIEINHIFDLQGFMAENPGFDFDSDLSEWKYDIPMKERLFKISFDRDEEEIKRIESRVKEGWLWMENNLFNE